MSTSRVLTLSESILQKPKYVEVDYARRISEVAHALKDVDLSIPSWDWPGFYPQSDDFEEMCLFYCVFNAINYCYFDQNGVRFSDGEFSGSTLAGRRLTERWDEIKDPVFLSNIDENYLLTELFPAKNPISLYKERTNALRELGRFLCQNVDFTFEKFFLKYRKDAYLASQVLPYHLESWRDPFFKRAQLFVAMVYGRFQEQERLPIYSESLQRLTVFADYKVPQALFSMHAIKADPAASRLINNSQFISSGSIMELEIRAASVVASDLLLKDLQKYRNDSDLNALHIDYLLWSITRKPEAAPQGIFPGRIWPHHLTMSTDY